MPVALEIVQKYSFGWMCSECGAMMSSNIVYMADGDECRNCGKAYSNSTLLEMARLVLREETIASGLKLQALDKQVKNGVATLVGKYPIKVKGYGVITDDTQLWVFIHAMENLISSYNYVNLQLQKITGVVDGLGIDGSSMIHNEDIEDEE